MAELRSAIRLALDCSDLCHATASVLGRHSQVVPLALRRLLEACAEACEACAQECELLESLDYCRLCAVECRRCEQACRALLAAM